MLAALLCNQPLVVIHGPGDYRNVLWGPPPRVDDEERVREVYEEVKKRAKPDRVQEAATVLEPFVAPEVKAPGWIERLTSLPPVGSVDFPDLARDEYAISLLWQIYIEIQIAARRRDDEEAILVLLLS